MRLGETDQDSVFSVQLDSASEAGPSFAPGPSNGHNGAVSKANGFAHSYTNGATKPPGRDGVDGSTHQSRHGLSIGRVSLPGSTLYDDSYVDREEFVRLVIQSLRDVGYIESAATLEAESGYTMESPEVAEFRRCILDADWNSAQRALMRLGVPEDDRLWEAKFLISQQKYLELLETNKTTAALQVLRHELAPLNVDPDQLHSLSSLIMCSDPADLRRRAGWDGASGTSRRQLLVNLQRYIPSSIMIPQRRFATLLDQARAWQQSQCFYHNAPFNSRTFSLYADHLCDKDAFPRVTTAILQVHTDEVWNMEWSHSGDHLASASRDKTAIIWRIEHDQDPSIREISPQFVLKDHPYPVGCVAWSLDDSVLLTAAEHFIKLWNTRTGLCIRTLEAHTDVVTALVWLPDGSGFISGGLDRRIILWDSEGKQRDSWGQSPIRVTDLAVTPDFTRLVAVGMYDVPSVSSGPTQTPSDNGATPVASRGPENRIIVYDLATKQPDRFIPLDGELTSVKLSKDSTYALVNRTLKNESPCEIHLWDLESERVVRKYTGHKQTQHVIRSCFGGIDDAVVASGSEDGIVYIWHRDSGMLLEELTGHGSGSVNSVAWNPRNERMFASCSDDKTIRIWEGPLSVNFGSPAHGSDLPHEQENGKGKGKSRERWNGAGVGDGYSFGASSTSL